MENTEYNEKIETLAWAFQVAKREGEVVCPAGFLCKIKEGELYCDELNFVHISEGYLTGWHRKLSPKEELIKKLAKVGAPRDTNEAYKIFMNVSEDYEVTKK